MCEAYLSEMLVVMVSLYEKLRQCQPEKALSFHLTHPDYTRETRRILQVELLSSWPPCCPCNSPSHSPSHS